ncbi:MAG: (Fe-S)-binding protein [Candidatus Lambdaproteobacteria bacterium]|nr:(Fe-S)-binding protein [Candidatus Lambdaproteobacteria bacterium]
MTSADPIRYPDKPETVYFFGTCLVDNFYAQAGLAAVELIEREGVRVIFPQGQTCCGQPPFNSGYRDEARRVARAQMALFPRPFPVVVPSGSCGAMFRVHYAELFGGPDTAVSEQAQAREFAARVFEWSEFMHHVLRVRWEDRGPPVRVSYHPSCHLQRELGVRRAPLALLEQLSGVTLCPVEDAEECCGFGGTFAVKQEPISAAMVDDKARKIVAGGAEVLVACDAGCLMNIGGALARQGPAPRVLPLAQFIKERVHEA